MDKKGGITLFFLLENGEERTYCITFDDNMMTAMTSFISGQPSKENIQSLGKNRVVCPI